MKYKFISDGNWTADIKAPDTIDDGFGGKNGLVEVDVLGASGSDGGAVAKAKINFVSWTMAGVQANYLTQSVTDASKKGMDLDSVTVGLKSYNKFVGNFLPNCPVYIEIALAEKEMENYEKEEYAAANLNYIYRKNRYDDDLVSWGDGLKNLATGLFTSPVEFLSMANNNEGSAAGPGSNPFLGHLKFGFNTPYVNFLTGFNYAKPDVRQAITWPTVCSSWDAGYTHAGGFNVFSMGYKAVEALEKATGVRFDVGFAPNKTGDRKGTKYGYWAWAGAQYNDWVFDFQTNGMYDGDYIFVDPVEHDFILGAKSSFKVGDGSLNFAVQGLAATHQKSSKDIGKTADYFGYSTDVFYRSGEFDGIKNMAANAQVGYKAENFGANVEYRLRGAEASMLYLRENHDDGTFDLSNALGVLNSQRVAFDGWYKPLETLQINLGVTAEMPLEKIKSTDDLVAGWAVHSGVWLNDDGTGDGWYANRCAGDMSPLFGVESGAELTFKPSVSYTIDYTDITFGAYGDFNYNAYNMEEDGFGAQYIGEKYGASNSRFRFKKAGATFSMTMDNDIVKGVNVFYGFDLSNSDRWFNTLVGQVSFPLDIKATLAVGLKTENMLSENNKFNADTNNPFAFALGVSKQFKAMQKPIVYAQFVFNMDPFKHFGDGQDQLNLDRANVNGSWAKEDNGSIDPVNWYDGRAAMRVGIRWDI